MRHWASGLQPEIRCQSGTLERSAHAARLQATFSRKPATVKNRVRFAAWDSAGNGAFTQPVHLQ